MSARGYSEVRVDAEIAEWPGVQVVRREKTAKHQRLVVRYNDIEKFVVYPLTPSDTRGELNHIQTVRQTLRDMGAVRNERRKAKVRRARNRTQREVLANIQAAPVKPNPFEALAVIQFAPPVVRQTVFGNLRQDAQRVASFFRVLFDRLKGRPPC
jgi:hypothetical protein